MECCPKCGANIISDFDKKGLIKNTCINPSCGHKFYSNEDKKLKKEIAIRIDIANDVDNEIDTDDCCMIIINNIKNIRDRIGLTQKELADKLGFTEQRYGTIERNTNSPTIILSARIANKLNVGVKDLYDFVYISKEDYEKIQYLNIEHTYNEDIKELMDTLAKLKLEPVINAEQIVKTENVIKKIKTSLLLKHGHVIERNYWEQIVNKFDIKIKE